VQTNEPEPELVQIIGLKQCSSQQYEKLYLRNLENDQNKPSYYQTKNDHFLPLKQAFWFQRGYIIKNKHT